MAKYFTVEEFRCKDKPGKQGTPYPAQWVESRWVVLAATLDVIREAAGEPLIVGSGYRTPEYNRAINGAMNSQHIHGRAADLRPTRMPAAELHALVLRLYREGRLPSIGGLGEYPTFTHVDVRPGKTLVRWRG